MAEQIDEAKIIAWLDGELPPEEAKDVARAVANEPALRRLADAHEAIRARFAATFAPIAAEPVALPARSSVVSLDSARAARAARTTAPPRPLRQWAVPGALAASLIVGFLIGQIGQGSGLGDHADALTIGSPLAQELDAQLSGRAGPVHVALSFRDREGRYCRSFTAVHLAGVACRAGTSWRLRYGAPVQAQNGDYRMAGNDPVEAAAVAALIAGEPLDAAAERKAQASGWR